MAERGETGGVGLGPLLPVTDDVEAGSAGAGEAVASGALLVANEGEDGGTVSCARDTRQVGGHACPSTHHILAHRREETTTIQMSP